MTFVYCRVDDNFSVCIKATLSCIKKNQIFDFAFEHG